MRITAFKIIIICCVLFAMLSGCNEDSEVSEDFRSVVEYIDNGNLSAVKTIVERNGNSAFTKTYANLTLLEWASASNQIGIMKYLLDQGADPNYSSEDGYPPLHNAAHSGGIEGVKLLVEYGAKIDEPAKKGAKDTPYLVAAGARRLDVCKFLLSKGADGARKNNGGFDALSGAMCGALKMRVDVVRFLVENGADPNREVYCSEPTTPLMMSAKDIQSKEIYDYLISVGADPDWQDQDGKTAAYYLENPPK